MALEYIPGKSLMHKLDPRSKLLFFLIMNFVVIGVTDPVTLFIIYIALLTVAKLAEIPLKKAISLIKPIIPALILYILLGYFYSIHTVQLYVPVSFSLFGFLVNFNFDIASFLISMANGIRFIIFVTLVRIITLVTPIDMLLHSLVKWKMPPEIATAFSAAFASIPVFINEIRSIMTAQISRGLKGLESRNPVKRGKALLPLLIPTVIFSTRRSSLMAVAIESRGFGKTKPTFRREIKFAKRDYIFILILIVIASIFVYLGSYFTNYLNYLTPYYFIKWIFSRLPT
ncbi:MAG: energy-coupling factor transporter transmembrane component T family protein [Candidatus Odinarchaeia archaeon]